MSANLNNDLKLLGLSHSGHLNERRYRLLSALKAICRFKESATGHQAAKYPGAMIMVRQAVPCILHMENRCGEKIVKTLLMEIIQLHNKTEQEEDEAIKKVEDVINNHILGRPWRPSNWCIPVAKNKQNKKVISEMTMPNQHVRKLIANFPIITAACFDTSIEEEKNSKESWDSSVALWRIVTEMARKREDFSDEDIEEFQDHCDNFTHQWLRHIPGDAGMTNNFHAVASGHLVYYLKEWRNLYRYSQQGWEGMNSVVKSLLHKRTQRGGHSRKKDGKNSKVEPIARWALRRLFFFSGDYKTKVAFKR